MKTSFTYNLLKHLRNKKEEGGFTLIELLVVIIIIGILAAIALPSFLNQANRARESEASNYMGAANRGQQAFFLEELNYAAALDDLEVGIPTETDNFTYGSDLAAPANGEGNGTFAFVDTDDQQAALYAAPTAESLKGFTAAIAANADQTEVSIICRTDAPGDAIAPTFNGGDNTDEPVCGATSSELGG